MPASLFFFGVVDDMAAISPCYVYTASCGATVDPSEVDRWECDLCRNDEALEASVVSIMTLLDGTALLPPWKSITTAFFALENDPSKGKSLDHHPIPTLELVNRLRLKAGHTFCVPCSCLVWSLRILAISRR